MCSSIFRAFLSRLSLTRTMLVRWVGLVALLGAVGPGAGCAQIIGLEDVPPTTDRPDAGAGGASTSGGGRSTSVGGSSTASGGSGAGGSSSGGGGRAGVDGGPAGGAGAAGDAGVSDGSGPPIDGDVDTTCIVNGKRCHDGHPEQWTGTTWQSLGNCDVSIPYCYCGVCLGCQPGSYRCVTSALQQCSTTGDWTPKAACAGATPICNAQTGSCVGTRLVGGFSTIGPTVTSPTGARVVGGELLLLPRVCNGAMSACVQGGFVP